MKIMILTGKFGMGHISAAKAIKERFDAEYGEGAAQIVDLVAYLVPRETVKISQVFDLFAKRFSGTYNLISKVAAHGSTVPMKHWFVRRFDNLLHAYQPDVIISTWPVASKYIGFYKTTKGCNVPFFTCVTDISPNNMWLAEETTAYFIGSDISKKALVSKGIDPEKIFVSGIPVKRVFKEDSQPVSADELPNNILVMGGGLGIIPGIDNLLDAIDRNKDISATVIAGNNAKLEKRLREKYRNIEIIGFTDQVARYMKRADLVITKAGGISMFEAIHSNTPILAIKPFLVQERDNATYIEKAGIGRIVNPQEDECESIIASMLTHESQQKMKTNMRGIADKCNSIDMVDVIRSIGIGA